MAHPRSSADDAPFELQRTELLRARLAIDVHPDSHFGIISRSGSADILHHGVKPTQETGGQPSDGAGYGECHTVLFDRETERQQYVVTEATEHCVSTVFAAGYCLSDPESISSGVLTERLVVSDKQAFRQILERLDQCALAVSVECLLTGERDQRPVQMAVPEITEKQEVAIETALGKGYYEKPRQASVSDLAEELGVTDSAVSQRLGAAEAKLVKSLFDD
jgi:hypothetical protein